MSQRQEVGTPPVLASVNCATKGAGPEVALAANAATGFIDDASPVADAIDIENKKLKIMKKPCYSIISLPQLDLHLKV